MVILVVFQHRLEWHQTVLTTHIHHVIDSPVHLPHSPRRVPKTLKSIHKHDATTNTDPNTFNCFQHRVDDMRAGLEDIGPDIVEEVHQGIFTTEALNPQGQVFDGSCGCLSMNQISISEGILQQRSNSINVIFGHLPYVLKHECQALEHTVLNI